MHVARTDGPNQALPALLPDGEHQKDHAPGTAPSCCPHTRFRFRVLWVRNDQHGRCKQRFDLCDRYPMLLALGAVTGVPIKAGYGPEPGERLHKCIYKRNQTTGLGAVSAIVPRTSEPSHLGQSVKDPQRQASISKTLNMRERVVATPVNGKVSIFGQNSTRTALGTGALGGIEPPESHCAIQSTNARSFRLTPVLPPVTRLHTSRKRRWRSVRPDRNDAWQQRIQRPPDRLPGAASANSTAGRADRIGPAAE